MSASTSIDHEAARPITASAGLAGHRNGPWFSAVPGETLQIRVRSAEVGGRFTVVESLVLPGVAVPLHTHREDEIFHLVDGVVTFEIEGRRFEARPGAVVVAPAGVPHRWANFGNSPARMMVTLAPGGIEEMFEAIAQAVSGEFPEIAARYGSVILGPPLER